MQYVVAFVVMMSNIQLRILMMSSDAATAHFKFVWTCLVRYTAVQQDILLCSYK